MHIDYIEYATRDEMVAALHGIRTAPGVVAVDIVDLGRTLRVQHTGEAVLEASDALLEPVDPPAATVVPPAPSEGSETPSEPSEPGAPEASSSGDGTAATSETPESGDSVPPEPEEDLIGAPPVPPTSKKGGRR